MMAKERDPSEPVAAPVAERVACPDCGLVQVLPPPEHAQLAECARCGRVLAGPATGHVATPLALFAATLLLLVPAMVAPLIAVSTFGAQRLGWMSTTATGLWNDGFPSLAILVALFSIAVPIVFLALLIWVLANLHLGRTAGLGRLFRWTKLLRPWVMVEVYLVGCFVSYSRVKVVASVDVAVGGWCLLAAAFVLLFALIQLDERTVWEMLQPQSSGKAGDRTAGCTVCDLIVPAGAAGEHCPRCGATIRLRKARSLERTAALVIAGYLLYIPANTLPVLTTVRFGREEHNTILSGVLELIQNDLWPLAVIVFTASIILPLVKLLGLTWMLLETRRGSSLFLVGRTRFYRTIDAIGRWSNIDVFAVSMLVAILQFGALTAVHAGNGLIAFAAVVIITMIATSAFDTRLMWDALRSRHD